ncbi:MAG: UDP-N-acetylmuramate--L-alanine ligase, partial [Desulfatitalea sp.]|nr:UDP-N-acetylmuramate--L-alanine ligase [Desulfatitalea sp.]
IAVGLELGIEFAKIKKALERVEGVQRRLEIKGEAKQITVVDDYGHHPTEIKTTLEAMTHGWPGRRKVVVFQPHRLSRTKALFDDFARSFYQCDVLLVLPIYAASERPIEGVESRTLCDSIRARGHKDVRYVEDMDAALEHLTELLEPGDVVLTLGAGNVYRLGERLVARLKGEVKE